ncbi:MAG TPA: lysozyme [Clostridiales bacterium]|nr:lysozyme [Clostridiales bacterium]
MRTDTKGIKLIEKFEGCKLKAYKCPAGVWTIGIGHTGTVLGKKVGPGMKITYPHAIRILNTDIKKFETYVNQYVQVPVTQNQFDALVSFCFNVGPGNLKKSTLLKKLNKKDYAGAAAEFPKWNKGDIDGSGTLVAIAGLTRRRKAEQELFNLK